MRILIISDVPTHPINAGNKRLINAYTTLFKEWGHEVHFLMINRYNMRPKYQKDTTEGIFCTSKEWGQFYHQYNYSTFENIKSNLNILLGKLLHNGYRKCDDIYPSGLHQTFLKLHKIYKFEAVIVNYFYLSKILEFIPLKKKSLFTHDSFSLNAKSSEHQAAYYLTREEEKKALTRAPYIFAMQDIEAEYFKSLSPNSKILINYSNFTYQPQPCANNHNILYLSGSSKFNKEGLDWFINDIFPSIKLKYQDAKLYIAGSICNILNEYQNNKDIELVGKINNPYQFFLKGDIAINPCQHGSGLKIKTFEAMSYDKVVMTHPHSTIGIFNKDQAPIFSSIIAHEWITFIEKVWEQKDFLLQIKHQNRIYIKGMNSFIEKQYKTFLYS